MPKHNHGNYSAYFGPGNWTGWLSGGGEKNISYLKVPTDGNDEYHNNIQPYVAVYYYRRIS